MSAGVGLVGVFTMGEWKVGGLTFSELTVHLPAKDVEEIRWCGHICYLHVAVLVLAVELLWRWEDPRVFIAKLQIPFHSAGRVLRPLTIIAMRQ